MGALHGPSKGSRPSDVGSVFRSGACQAVGDQRDGVKRKNRQGPQTASPCRSACVCRLASLDRDLAGLGYVGFGQVQPQNTIPDRCFDPLTINLVG
jgi:hypothetical protein